MSIGTSKPPVDTATGRKPKITEDFKIALMAMVGEEAIGELTEQFFSRQREK